MSEVTNDEVYELKVGRDSETGLPRWLTVRLNGKLHSPPDDRPAKVVYDDQGQPTEMGWFRENRYHRTSGPSLQQIDTATNVVVYEEHRCFGKMHRLHSKPALTTRDPATGDVVEARYFVNDQEVVARSPSKLDLGP